MKKLLPIIILFFSLSLFSQKNNFPKNGCLNYTPKDSILKWEKFNNFKFDSIITQKIELNKKLQKKLNKNIQKFLIDDTKCYKICFSSNRNISQVEVVSCLVEKNKLIAIHNYKFPDNISNSSKIENCTLVYSSKSADSTIYKSVKCKYIPSLESSKLNSNKMNVDYKLFDYNSNDCFIKYNDNIGKIKGWFFVDCNLAKLDSISLKSIQRELIELGYKNIEESGYIDNLTILAYENYVKKYSKILVNQTNSKEIKSLQYKLKNLGYNVDITGILDKKTKIAQKQYTKDLKKKR